jgi:hypothetical protein
VFILSQPPVRAIRGRLQYVRSQRKCNFGVSHLPLFGTSTALQKSSTYDVHAFTGLPTTWRRRLARRRPHTGQQQWGGGHRDTTIGRRRLDLRPAGSRRRLQQRRAEAAASIVSGRRTLLIGSSSGGPQGGVDTRFFVAAAPGTHRSELWFNQRHSSPETGDICHLNCLSLV